MMWSSFPPGDIWENKFLTSASTVVGEARLQTMPWMRPSPAGLVLFSRCTALETRSSEEEEMMTEALCSSRASAMPKPMPEVPPITRTRASWSFDV